MKKAVTFMMVLTMMAFMTACGNNGDAEESNAQTDEIIESTDMTDSEETAASSETPAPVETEEEAPGTESEEAADMESEVAAGQENILIAYFSIPEDISIDGIDANAGASVVVKDGEKIGNVQYIAQIIQDTVGGDLFRIETVQQYPLDHEPLVDQAAEEQNADARPELATHIENLDQYDTIILGYPNMEQGFESVLCV